MSFLDAVMETRATVGAGMHPRDPLLVEWLGGRETISGASITPQSALNISPWYSCVRILSETIASLPIITYRRLDRGRERASEHPVYPLLKDAPNPFMTTNEFIESRQGHLLGWGNAFAEIERNSAGQVVALWPIPPDRVRVQITPDRLWYWVRVDGAPELQLRQDQMLHVRGLSSDGIIGYGIVDLLRESLGLTKIEEEYRARFFKNDARPGGSLCIGVRQPYMKWKSRQLHEKTDEKCQHQPPSYVAGQCQSHQVGIIETQSPCRLLMQECEGDDRDKQH